jgi:hypothetical protein
VSTTDEVSCTELDPDSTVVTSSWACLLKSESLLEDGAADTVVPIVKTINAASTPANFFFIGFSSFL